MGRRALRKNDPSLDLSRNFRTFEQLPQPWNAAAVFGRTAPLEVEIGTGKGLFLRSAAADRPTTDFLGIEIAYRYAQFAAGGLARRGLANAVVVAGDAAEVLDLLPDAAVDAFHLYFPDPWWKKRHKKRRVIRTSLVQRIEQTLQPGGQLHFWTDVEEYFRSGIELLRSETRLEGPFDVPERPAEHALDYRTHFERRTRLHGEPVYRSLFCKPAPTEGPAP